MSKLRSVRIKLPHWLTAAIGISKSLVSCFSIPVLILIGLWWLWPSSEAQDNVIQVPLAVISGGLLSTGVILFVEDRYRAKRIHDLRYSLASELNLNINWARYNSGPQSDLAKRVVWVPFRLDAFLSALQQSSAFDLTPNVWTTIERAADRMHSFNANRETAYQLMNVSHSELPQKLQRAMLRQGRELYYYYFPLLAKDLPYTEAAIRNYGKDLENARRLTVLRAYRDAQCSSDPTDVLADVIKEAWGVNIAD